MGAITDQVRRLVPATYNEMIITPSATDRLYSTGDLQALADYVQFKLFSTAVGSGNELAEYGQYKSQFLGKLTTLQFIPPAVDFWDSRLASLVSTGTNEQVNYRDHREGLLKLYDILTKEVREEARYFGINLKGTGLLPRVSYGDNGNGTLITPDPSTFPPMDNAEDVLQLVWTTP